MTEQNQARESLLDAANQAIEAEKQIFHHQLDALTQLQTRHRKFVSNMLQYSDGLPEESRKLVKTFNDRLLQKQTGLGAGVTDLASAWLEFTKSQMNAAQMRRDCLKSVADRYFDSLRASIDRRRSSQ